MSGHEGLKVAIMVLNVDLVVVHKCLEIDSLTFSYFTTLLLLSQCPCEACGEEFNSVHELTVYVDKEHQSKY
jgi:hypothetical protein